MVQTQAFVIYLSGPSPEGKFYVGQTGNFERRCRDHKIASGTCPHFHDAIKKFGWEILKPAIIAETDMAEEADRLERLLIAKYNALFPHGYNLTLGGRFTTFDPKARVTSFEEAPVTEDEIISTARRRLQADGCPVCGTGTFSSICHHCEVHHDFGRTVLQHLIDGGAEDYVLQPEKRLKKALRDSKDADFLINLNKSRLGVRKIDEALPVVAAEYAKRLLPYIRQSLKRDVLVEKRLPSYTLGRFIPFLGSKADALTVMAVERLLRKHRKQLGANYVSNVEVFTKGFEYYGTTDRRTEVIKSTLADRGASSDEINEALAERALLSRLALQKGKELERFQQPEESTAEQRSEPAEKTDPSITFTISFREPTAEERLREQENFFADHLSHLAVIEEKPALFLTHEAINPKKIVVFDTLKSRREFVDSLLEIGARARLEIAQNLVTDASRGFSVSEWTLPPRREEPEPPVEEIG